MIRVSPWVPPLVLVGVAAVCLLVQDLADPTALALAGASALVALVGAVQSVANGLRPVAAAYYLFWFAWLGIGPIAQLAFGRVAWGDTRTLSDPVLVRVALALTALAIACFWIGDLVGRSVRPGSGRAATTATIRPAAHLLVIAALIAVGVNAVGVLGFDTLFASRNERGDALAASGGSLADAGGPIYALYTVLPAGLAIAAALLGVYRIQLERARGSRIGVRSITALAIGAAGIILFANPLSQTRFIALLAFGSLLIAILRPRSTRAGFAYLAVGATATLVVYPLAAVFRQGGDLSLAQVTSSTFTTADFDGFQQVVNTLRFVDAHGLAGGRYLASAVLFFVPRSIWSEKAPIASADVAGDAGYLFTNLSLPIFAELYLQFGILGIIGGMALLGAVAARVDRAWLLAPLSKTAMLAPLLAVAMFGVLRGPLGAQVPVYLPAILILLVALRAGRGSDGDLGPPPSPPDDAARAPAGVRSSEAAR